MASAQRICSTGVYGWVFLRRLGSAALVLTLACVSASVLGLPYRVQAQTDFTIAASPSSLTVVRGSSVQSSLVLTSLNGFSGSVGLGLEGGMPLFSSVPVVTFAPSTVNVPVGGSAYSVMNISTTSSTPPGVYSFGVHAIGASTHYVYLSVNVAVPAGRVDFDLYASVSKLWVVLSSAVNLTLVVRSLNGFIGGVVVGGQVSPQGQMFSVSPIIVSLVRGSTTSVFLTVASSSLTPAGTYSLNVTGSGGSVFHSFLVPVEVTAMPSFDAAAVPAYMKIHEGGVASFMIAAKSLNGFSLVLYLQILKTASGPSLSLVVSQINLFPGGSGAIPIQASTTSFLPPVGSYFVVVEVTPVLGGNGLPGLEVLVLLDVTPGRTGPDIFLSVEPNNSALVQGATANLTVRIFRIEFAEPVALSSYGSLRISLNPSIAMLGVSNSKLAVAASTTTPVGIYPVWILGTTQSGLSQAVRLDVTVSPFGIVLSNSELVATPGSNVTATVTVTGVSWFSGRVNLTVTSTGSRIVPRL